MIPVDQSTGEIVQGQLDELARQVGVLLGIVSDLGSDTRKGMRLFQARGQAWRPGRLRKFGSLSLCANVGSDSPRSGKRRYSGSGLPRVSGMNGITSNPTRKIEHIVQPA